MDAPLPVMSRRSLDRTGQKPPASSDVDAFLDKVSSMPAKSRGAGGIAAGRLIFALDATASRQPAWDQAMSLQAEMFGAAGELGGLEIQLAFYRGHRECHASAWLDDPDRLLAMMQKVTCLAGRTQIGRLLSHAAAEARQTPVQALVFIGDAVEEDIDSLGELAGKLNILGLPVFIFQEGADPTATRAFEQIAKISGGAHCRFDASSAAELGALLSAVATYATAGRAGLEALAVTHAGTSSGASRLLEQLGK